MTAWDVRLITHGQARTFYAGWQPYYRTIETREY